MMTALELVCTFPDLLVTMSEKSIAATMRAVRDAETKAASDTEIMKTMLIKKEISTSYPARPNPGTKNGDPDQEPEIIWVPTSDDEHTDADGEEDEEKFLGAAPLGTSDLDVRDDWRVAGRLEYINETPEEDELQEVVSAQTANDITRTAALTLSHFSESGNPDGLHGACSIRSMTAPTTPAHIHSSLGPKSL